MAIVLEKVNFIGGVTDSHPNISSEDSETVLVGYAIYRSYMQMRKQSIICSINKID